MSPEDKPPNPSPPRPAAPRRIAVIGAGAVGGFFAARLQQAGHELSVLARGATLQAVRHQGGIRLHSGGVELLANVRAAEAAEELGAQDLVIIAVKSPALATAAGQIGPLLAPGTLVLPMLNGIPWWFFDGDGDLAAMRRPPSLDPQGRIAAAIATARIVGSVIYPSFSCPEPGVVVHASGTRCVFGEVAGGASERVTELVALLQAAGVGAEVSADIRREVWAKLLGNACFNPVSLLTGSHTDDMIDDPALHALFVGMMNELLALGRAIGVPLEIDPLARLATTRKLGHIQTSMLQDVNAGRAVELDTIIGAAVDVAGRVGVSVPLLSAVCALAGRRASVLGLYEPVPASR